MLIVMTGDRSLHFIPGLMRKNSAKKNQKDQPKHKIEFKASRTLQIDLAPRLGIVKQILQIDYLPRSEQGEI